MCSKAIKNLDKWNKFAIIFCLIQTVCRGKKQISKILLYPIKHFKINHFKEDQLGEP